jgi:hypothetical protein
MQQLKVWLVCFCLVSVSSFPLAQDEEDYDPTSAHPLEGVLEDLGVYECPGAPSLQCVTLPVPLDPFRKDEKGEMLDVTFGIHLAKGERRGMLVVVVGGPGMAGIINGQYYLDANRFGNQILGSGIKVHDDIDQPLGVCS